MGLDQWRLSCIANSIVQPVRRQSVPRHVSSVLGHRTCCFRLIGLQQCCSCNDFQHPVHFVQQSTCPTFVVLTQPAVSCHAVPCCVMLHRDWDSDSDREGFGPNRRSGSRAGGRRGGCNGRSESELMLLDPKRVKRILANRESAARSKVRMTWG